MTAVELRGIRKAFGTARAVAGLDLAVGAGEFLVLLGPSGCGKTTTLRIVAGLDRPDAGTVRFDGRDMAPVAVRDRDVGFVFQRYALFPHMDVAANVGFGLRVRGVDRGEAARAVDEMLDVVGLAALRGRYPAALSGGQMQRAALARTLVTRPRVLLMDEPLANLDAALRGEMRRFLRGLQRRFGTTTILVTHDQAEAMEVADRVAVVLDGRVAQVDGPEAVYRRPLTRAVAAFMGADQVLPGERVAPDRVRCALGVLTVDPAVRPTGSVGVVVRPEAIRLDTARPNGAAVEGRVAAVRFGGAAAHYRVEAGGMALDVSRAGGPLLPVGAPVWLSVPPDGIWLIEGGAAAAPQGGGTT